MDDKVDIANILSKLATRSNRIVVNPADVEALQKRGVKFDEPPKRTLEESIDLMFLQKKEGALDRAKQLPALPQIPYSITSLYEEIITCIIFGLYGAAITLSGILVEFVLKMSTLVHEAGGYHYDPKQWDAFERITLAAAIKRASKAALITDIQVKQLTRFKDEVRNPYNHYNIKKITSAVVWEKVQVVNLETGAVEEKTIAAQDDPLIQAQAKPMVDQKRVFEIFTFADGVTRYLRSTMQRLA
jgi:hypothetical protein